MCNRITKLFFGQKLTLKLNPATSRISRFQWLAHERGAAQVQLVKRVADSHQPRSGVKEALRRRGSIDLAAALRALRLAHLPPTPIFLCLCCVTVLVSVQPVVEPVNQHLLMRELL